MSTLFVIDMNDRYDLILGYALLEDQEPWIDWRTRHIASSSPDESNIYGRHDPCVDIYQCSNCAIKDRAHYVGPCDIAVKPQVTKTVRFAKPVDSKQVIASRLLLGCCFHSICNYWRIESYRSSFRHKGVMSVHDGYNHRSQSFHSSINFWGLGFGSRFIYLLKKQQILQ
ncbi:hypothetical protein Plhal304r1_c002g0005581 [Plasmopara halstedii]